MVETLPPGSFRDGSPAPSLFVNTATEAEYDNSALRRVWASIINLPIVLIVAVYSVLLFRRCRSRSAPFVLECALLDVQLLVLVSLFFADSPTAPSNSLLRVARASFFGAAEALIFVILLVDMYRKRRFARQRAARDSVKRAGRAKQSPKASAVYVQH